MVISLPLLLEGLLTRIILNTSEMHAAPTYTPTLVTNVRNLQCGRWRRCVTSVDPGGGAR